MTASVKRLLRYFGFFSLFIGGFTIFYTLMPFVDYGFQSRTKFYKYLSPVPEGSLSEKLDYTNPENWFPGYATDTKKENLAVNFYTITIERLGIKNAPVAIGGSDLSQSLVQYLGTAIPGSQGNTVIFGHSVLPIFFRSEDPLSIFSTLNELEKEDRIVVVYDGVTYTYSVYDMFEVKPTDLYILDQQTGSSFLSLVTCSPPGHPLRPKRLVVKAKMVPFNQT